MRLNKQIAGIGIACVLAGCFLGYIPAQEGPKKESGETVARPKKKGSKDEPDAEAPKIPSKLTKKDKELPQGVPTFRILEDGVPQPVASLAIGEAPMTVCLVIEFSNKFQYYYGETWYQTLTAAYGFLETLKKDDYVAVIAYDIRPEILSDFSTDKRAAYEAMQRLRIAAFSESNMYDSLVDTADRMSEIEGRKAIVLIASGIDTFSKLTFDKTRKALQSASVPIYAIGLMQAIREMADARGAMGAIQRLDFLQADNQLRTFTKETGGKAYFP